jgi:hypothetical protein
VPHDCGIADDVGGLIREGDKLPWRWSIRRGVDKLGLGLDPAPRMAITELRRGEGIELAPVGLQHGVPEGFHGLRHRRLVGGLRHHYTRRAHQRQR